LRCHSIPERASIRIDAIAETFNVKPEHIHLEIEDSENEYIARFRDPHCHDGRSEAKLGRLLGYIRYSKQKGTLELTNFKAQLSRRALKVGVTTTRQKLGMASTHGVGFKAASLVMLREGYQVRFEASRFYWNFRLAGAEKDTLHCFFSTSKD
jgi:hypothetical protein